MTNNEILDNLINIAKEINVKIIELSNFNTIAKKEIMYLKTEISEFKFEIDSVKSFSRSRSIINKSEYGSSLSSPISQLLEKSSNYHNCIQAISTFYSMPIGPVYYWLSSYSLRLAVSLLENDEESEVTVNNWAYNFLQILNEELVWNIKIHLNGIWAIDKEVKLTKNITLRQPVASDFESIEYIEGTSEKDWRSVSSVLELQLTGSQYQQPENEIHMIIDMMRLYRLGSVVDIQISQHSNKPTLGFTGSLTHHYGYTHFIYKYGADFNDKESFENFIYHMQDVIQEVRNQKTPIGIAYQRYESALFDKSIESRITSAISCLEALYLSGNSEGELTRTLRQRAALLIGIICKKSSIDIYMEMRDAYSIRSKFVHGSILKKSKSKDTSKLCEAIMNYARISLLSYLQLKIALNEQTKVKFLDEKLDTALIDFVAREKLVEFVKSVLIT